MTERPVVLSTVDDAQPERHEMAFHHAMTNSVAKLPELKEFSFEDVE